MFALETFWIGVKVDDPSIAECQNTDCGTYNINYEDGTDFNFNLPIYHDGVSTKIYGQFNKGNQRVMFTKATNTLIYYCHKKCINSTTTTTTTTTMPQTTTTTTTTITTTTTTTSTTISQEVTVSISYSKLLYQHVLFS